MTVTMLAVILHLLFGESVHFKYINTMFIGIKDFRQNMAMYAKKA
jgi:hypothetical protein